MKWPRAMGLEVGDQMASGGATRHPGEWMYGTDRDKAATRQYGLKRVHMRPGQQGGILCYVDVEPGTVTIMVLTQSDIRETNGIGQGHVLVIVHRHPTWRQYAGI